MVSLTLLSAPLLAAAQYSSAFSPPSTPAVAASTPSAAPPPARSAPPNTPGNINIDVMFQGGLVFNPTNVTAPIGTNVNFYFPDSAVSHSVTQSTFEAPCTYLAAANGSPGGFDSGLQIGKEFTITITDDANPIWFHCKQKWHCGMGMVGIINPPAGNTFASFLAAALAVGSSEILEIDHGFVSGGVYAQATASPSAEATST